MNAMSLLVDELEFHVEQPIFLGYLKVVFR